MAKELNNENWMLRSARLDKPSDVQKLLREGFEPFWGTTVLVNKEISDDGVLEKEKVVRMYFRKPPVLKLETASLDWFDPTEQLTGALTEFSNLFRSGLSGILDTFMDGFFARLDNYEFSQRERPNTNEFVELIKGRELNLSEHREPVVEGNLITGDDNHEGDKFRVVDDVPQHTTQQRTDAQNSVIEKLRSQGNITILPSTDENVRCMAGADLYTIEVDGNFTRENTGAGTDSTAVGG